MSFAADIPTIFETAREGALTALNGIAEVGAGLLTGTEQNARQAIASILRAMAQLLAKMVVMWAMLQLIRAIPGGSALLAAMDYAAKGGAASAPISVASQGPVGIATHAKGGIGGMGEILTVGKRLLGGVRSPYNPAVSIHGEGQYPEAYIPMLDRRTIPVRFDDDGNAHVPLPSGMAIPVKLENAKANALGGVGGMSMAQRRRADVVSMDSRDAVAQGRGTAVGPTVIRNESSFHIPITINGNATRDDADRIGREVYQRVDQLLSAREAENARQQARNRSSVQGQYLGMRP